jgi:arylsulfatase A-like enzyme
MYGQGIKEDTIVRQQVSLIDLAPTIDNLAGNDDVKLFQGKNLQPAISGKESATGGTISVLNRSDWGRRLIAYRTSDWKYILTESTDGNGTLFSEEIYDLKSDPKERYNLHGLEDGKAKAFELEAVDKILEFKRLKRGEETAYEKERIKARLRKSPKL